MLSDYMDKALQQAQYEHIEDGTVFGTIPGFEGLWANAPTEAECQNNLRETLEGWLLLGIAQHAALPEVDGVKLEIGKVINA